MTKEEIAQLVLNALTKEALTVAEGLPPDVVRSILDRALVKADEACAATQPAPNSHSHEEGHG